MINHFHIGSSSLEEKLFPGASKVVMVILQSYGPKRSKSNQSHETGTMVAGDLASAWALPLPLWPLWGARSSTGHGRHAIGRHSAAHGHPHHGTHRCHSAAHHVHTSWRRGSERAKRRNPEATAMSVMYTKQMSSRYMIKEFINLKIPRTRRHFSEVAVRALWFWPDVVACHALSLMLMMHC